MGILHADSASTAADSIILTTRKATDATVFFASFARRV